MRTPLLHEKTERTLTQLWQSNAHGLLLTGQEGVGLATIAKYYAEQSDAMTLWLRPEKDDAIDYEKGSIAIAAIRDLYELIKTKNGKKQRVIIIDAAERMAEPAQNAFLKLLEEPPEGVRFVLLTHTPETILPTIRSRTQLVEVLPITRQQSEAHLDTLKVMDATKRTQLLFIADGLPAELARLSADEDTFAARAAIVRDARTLISGTPYERLKIAQSYKDSRQKALQLIDDALKQLRRTIEQSGDANLLERMPQLVAAYDAIKQNGNVRLQLAATIVV
ncbi:AAA family ATPase [Candidatus Saccharibacteria bacterium TM7i]|nr:AAA family ATPase [Candidatus Saccharibacteria bacterium TM7i]